MPNFVWRVTKKSEILVETICLYTVIKKLIQLVEFMFNQQILHIVTHSFDKRNKVRVVVSVNEIYVFPLVF